LPTTREGFRALVEGLNLMTDSGLEAYNTLLSISGAADTYYSYNEDEASDYLTPIEKTLGRKLPSSSGAYLIQEYKQRMSERESNHAKRDSKNNADSFSSSETSRAQAVSEAAAEAATKAAEALTEAEDALKSAFEAKKDALTEAYNTQLEIYQSNLDKVTESVEKLTSAKESLIETDNNPTYSYGYYQRELKNILNAARNGDTSLIAGMDNILSGVTDKSAMQKNYSNLVDYTRAYWQTYSAISELESIMGEQKTDAQELIDTLTANHEAELSALDDQLNALLNISDNIASVDETLQAAITAYNAAKTKVSTSNSGDSINRAYADGGIASGPDSGYEATLHGTELVVSPKSSYPATVTGGLSSADLKEIKDVLLEIKSNTSAGATYSYKAHKILDKLDTLGIAERAA
jgi:chemotaxis protein histidine kinase CheA